MEQEFCTICRQRNLCYRIWISSKGIRFNGFPAFVCRHCHAAVSVEHKCELARIEANRSKTDDPE